MSGDEGFYGKPYCVSSQKHRKETVEMSRFVRSLTGANPGRSAKLLKKRLELQRCGVTEGCWGYIDDGCEGKFKTGAAFVDLSVAYDSINHCVFLQQFYKLTNDAHITHVIKSLHSKRCCTVARWQIAASGLKKNSLLHGTDSTQDLPVPKEHVSVFLFTGQKLIANVSFHPVKEFDVIVIINIIIMVFSHMQTTCVSPFNLPRTAQFRILWSAHLKRNELEADPERRSSHFSPSAEVWWPRTSARHMGGDSAWEHRASCVPFVKV